MYIHPFSEVEVKQICKGDHEKTLKRYLDSEDILASLKRSITEEKVVIIPDTCGTGKTKATIDFIAKNYRDGILYVAEKTKTIDEIGRELVKRGIPEINIGVYHHKSEENINEVYQNAGSKLVALITHRRLLLDPMHIWLNTSYGQTKFSPQNHKKWIIVDEQPSLVQSVKIVKGSFGNVLIKRITQCAKDRLKEKGQWNKAERLYREAIDESKYVDGKDAKVILTEYGIDFEKVTEMIVDDSLRHNVTDLLPVIGVVHYEDSIKCRNQSEYNKAVYRLLYLIRRTYSSVITGRIREDSGVIDVTTITPLTDFLSGVVMLDGTARISGSQLEYYPDDLCIVEPSRTEVERRKVKVKIVKGRWSKRDLLQFSRPKYNLKANQYKQFLELLIRCGQRYGNYVYYVGYKDKSDIASPHEEKISKDDSYEGKVELIYNIESTVEYKDSGSPIAFRSQVKSLLNKLNTEDVLVLDKDNLDSSGKAKFTLSYYGLTKGSNHFDHCDTVILQGPFYFPSYFYNNIETHARVKQVKVDRLVAAHAFQELMRSALRKSEDITLIIGDDSDEGGTAGWIECLLNHMAMFHDVELIEEESEEEREYKLYYSRYGIAHVLESIGDERLRKTLNKLTLEYPEILDDVNSPNGGIVEINVSEFAKKLNRESDKVLKSIRKIVKGSKGTLGMKVVQEGKSRSKPTLIRLWINRSMIVQ